ncbi:MAG: S9 family peptidase [Steroidobacteraceae bacterium]
MFAALTVTGSAFAADPAPATSASGLIPRSALFGNPVRTQARLSPDARYVSFLAPKDGVLNVWLAEYGKLEAARPITDDKKRGIRQHFWSADGKHVLFLQDEGGDENWRVYGVDAQSGKQTDLTPLAGVQAQVVGISHERPGVVLVGLNDRKPEWHDLYEIDIASGQRTLVERNDQEFGGYLEDLKLAPRLASKQLPDGSTEVFRRTEKGWESFFKYGQEDSLTTQPVAIEAGGNTALMLTSVGRDKSALVRLDLASGKQTVVAHSDKADVAGVWLDPRTRTPQAYAVNYLTVEHTPLTPAARKDIEQLTKALGPGFDVVSRTLDDKKWVVVVDDPVESLSSHLYDRDARKVTKLFDQRPELANAPLQPMWPVEIKARDGLTLVSYLTLPPGSDGNRDGRPDKPVPLVLNVHGGPWARDSFGFDAEHQWLANRGYAVLAVNYRASTGFGKSFINAGNLQWGRKAHDDLIDAIDWAVREKVAIPGEIAIYGGSYGGYATLAGLTMTPDKFKCGVDIVGPSNLITLLNSIPPYWKSFFEEFANRVGDPRTEEGQKLLTERSPLTHVDKIAKPLLIAQGANDPRVKQAESDQIVAAMKAKKLPVTYVLYPDEGHGFARPQNRLSFYAVAEGFLSQCLGGRQEAIGDDFDGSSIKVVDGADFVPGLAAEVRKREPSPAARTPSPNPLPAKRGEGAEGG